MWYEIGKHLYAQAKKVFSFFQEKHRSEVIEVCLDSVHIFGMVFRAKSSLLAQYILRAGCVPLASKSCQVCLNSTLRLSSLLYVVKGMA